jgi:hypothetical protein
MPDSPAAIDAAPDAYLPAQSAYLKSSNTRTGQAFGSTLALSGTGLVLAVGAPGEASTATGFDPPDQTDTSLPQAGAVYIYLRSGFTAPWEQRHYIKAASNTVAAWFGYAIALSRDGSSMAVGAPQDASGTGDPSDTSKPGAGIVRIFDGATGFFTEHTFLKASNANTNNLFGWSVAYSADGTTLVVGSPGEPSGAAGVNGNQNDRSMANAGAVYVFTRPGFNDLRWTQTAYIKPVNPQFGGLFGTSVAVSADGTKIVVGAPGESSGSAGIDGDPYNTNKDRSGAAYVFRLAAGVWETDAYLKASNPDILDAFGTSVAMSAAGDVIAVGAINESSKAAGLNGDELDNSAGNSGAVYVFQNLGAWSQLAYMKPAMTHAGDRFGSSLALSDAGDLLAVGAPGQSGSTVAQGGNVLTFEHPSSGWRSRDWLRATNAEADDMLGFSVAVSGAGSTVIAGAPGEDSSATNVGGDQSDNSQSGAGAAYGFQ